MVTRYVVRCEFADGRIMAASWAKDWTTDPARWYMFGKASNAQAWLKANVPARKGRVYSVVSIHVPTKAGEFANVSLGGRRSRRCDAAVSHHPCA